MNYSPRCLWVFSDGYCCVGFSSAFPCRFSTGFIVLMSLFPHRYYIPSSSDFFAFVDVEQVCSWNTLSSSSRIPISMQKCRHQ